ncbi:MAG: phytanoyl-CoA dioxygenase family protein [Erythrobacter sp.]|uniref:phytanoyl-CoA dioxygenase family protein n=1 Tax=Erythrobacter sp. TaxID=1042 RepID=UPI0025FD3948|nr:phytanoyl-CoA dioxygenase family protein [Erythrobacter sp.]MCM0000238.1 phytanoyl-CoA dioxygenase family protein [Erythrobacter sp.]
MPIVQKFTRFDESIIWSLLHRFYMEAGPAAWSDKIVPQRSTSNAFCADTYASIVASFFKELLAEGNSQPPLVIELGGGSGRFAWQFLNRLFNYHFSQEDPCPEFTYLLTDGSEKNIAGWKQKERFAPLVESGVLDFAQLLIEPDPVIRMQDGDVRPADLADRPVIIIANYLFDSIASNMLRIRDHQIEQVFVQTESTERKFLDRPITTFQSISERFESRPIEGDAPTGHPIIDTAIRDYARRSGDFHVVVPQICMEFIEKFLGRSTPLLLLAGDLAYTDPSQFELESPLIFDTYFAHYTNLHIFGEMFRAYGGDMQSQRHKDANFSCNLLSLPGKDEWAELSLTRTRETALALLKDFNPYDAHELTELIENTAGEMSIRQAMALIRFSKFDPDVAAACLPHLLFNIEQGEEAIDRPQIYETFMEAYRAFFPDGSESRLDSGIAQLFMRLGYHAQALQLMNHAIGEFGASAPRLFAMSLAYFNLGDQDKAEVLARKAVALDPHFAPAQRMIADKFEAPAAAVPVAAATSYAHVTVSNRDPKVTSKAAKLLADRGVVLIDDLLTADVVAELRSALKERVNNWQSSELGKPNNVGDKRFTVPIRLQAPFDNPGVYANPVLLETLQRVMGEKPVLHAFGSVTTYEGARMQHVHREHPLLFNTDAGNANVPCYATTILIPLIDLDEEAGGTQLWEGTHMTPKSAEWQGDPLVFYTKAGSALVFDYRTFHGGMPCRASHGRPLLYFTYTMPWFHDTLAFESHAAMGLSDAERMKVPEHHRDLFRFAKRIAA